MRCVFTKSLKAPSLPSGLFDLAAITPKELLCFPETTLSFIEQQQFDPKKKDAEIVITNSPFIVSCFRAIDVLVENDNGELLPPIEETYGAGFDVLLKQLNNIKSLLPQVAVDDIREQLSQGDDSKALAYILTMGLSMEQAYLKRKLAPSS